jgi:hypothetical protein
MLMFHRLILISLLVGSLTNLNSVHATDQNGGCDSDIGQDEFKCSVKAWVDDYFAWLNNSGRSNKVKWILERAGCGSSTYDPINNLIKQCEGKLGSEFGCKVTIQINKDMAAGDIDYYPQCCNLLPGYCNAP